MSFFSTRRTHRTRRSSAGSQPRASYCPGIEALEVRKLLTAGLLDPTFGTGGQVLTDFPVGSIRGTDFGRQVAIQPTDGKIVVVGHLEDPVTGLNQYGLARYNVNGSLDSSFDGDGRVRSNFPSMGQIQELAVQGVRSADCAVRAMKSRGLLSA